MSNYNCVIIMGRLTRDPEIKFTPKGSAVCDFSLAVNRTWTDNGEKREETTFIDLCAWGKTAELIGQYLQKGSQCLCDGRLTVDSWEDKATGQKRSKMKVTVETVQFIGSKPASNGEREESPQRPKSQDSQWKGRTGNALDGNRNYVPPQGGSEGDSEDIPFAPFNNKLAP